MALDHTGKDASKKYFMFAALFYLIVLCAVHMFTKALFLISVANVNTLFGVVIMGWINSWAF